MGISWENDIENADNNIYLMDLQWGLNYIYLDIVSGEILYNWNANLILLTLYWIVGIGSTMDSWDSDTGVMLNELAPVLVLN